MEYELLTGPRQGDCGGGDRIHNHTNARKCTKTLEMFPTNKSVTNTGKYSTTIAIVGVHSYQKIYKNSGGYIHKCVSPTLENLHKTIKAGEKNIFMESETGRTLCREQVGSWKLEATCGSSSDTVPGLLSTLCTYLGSPSLVRG